MNIFRAMDPRRSLVAAIIWLVVALAASFAIAASIWAGGVARDIVVQQHMRRLALETDQLGSDLGLAASVRLETVRAVGGALPPAELFEHLRGAYPELGWIAVADAAGNVLAAAADANSNSSLVAGAGASVSAWFSQGLKGPWIGLIDESRNSAAAPPLGDLSAPLKDASGRVVGVIAAHLSWHWTSSGVQRLSDSLDLHGSAQTLVLDDAGTVVVGPDALRNAPLSGVIMADSGAAHFETLPNGQSVLVSRATVHLSGESVPRTWQVQLSEPKEVVYQRADALAVRIWWISICLGVATALLGALGARHLTNRLKSLTRSAAAVGRNESARIEVPAGRDEVAQLAGAFAKILDDLRQERSELVQLSVELERRVAVRTREVERLAEESRYAAIARERLQIARDLHDTLAHSMMAMLSEVRLLRRLQVHDPASLPGELARAEEVAQAGLNEARSAITQMRANSVRDAGLGPALARAIERFKDHTGLDVEFLSDAAAARFGDERAEVIFRMSEEALRNIERHAGASRVRITLRMRDPAHLELQISDDGVGFMAAQFRPGHFGLIGLREQAQLIAADFDISSAPNEGTTLKLVLRIAPEPI
jgi:signal transduction histidine kinase